VVKPLSAAQRLLGFDGRALGAKPMSILHEDESNRSSRAAKIIEDLHRDGNLRRSFRATDDPLNREIVIIALAGEVDARLIIADPKKVVELLIQKLENLNNLIIDDDGKQSQLGESLTENVRDRLAQTAMIFFNNTLPEVLSELYRTKLMRPCSALSTSLRGN
jgi:hypothetical protein